MLKRLAVCVTALTLWGATVVGAWAEERFALVIGNSNYRTVSALPNPVLDAAAVETLLKSAAFDVTAARDLGQSDLHEAVRDFAAKLADKGPDTVALVYFAGHGLQIDGQNYLLPVDARIKHATDVPLEAVRLSDVMVLINGLPSKTRIVILDACRNNPFATLSYGGERGLSRVKAAAGSREDAIGRGFAIVHAPAGTVVAYATSPGAVAADGEGANSPFTAALVEAAKVPGAGLETVLKNVRLAVHKATEGRQTPWDVTALTRPFVFFPGTSDAAPEPRARKSKDAWRRDLRSRSTRQAYETVVREDDVIVYRIFLELYPDSPFHRRIELILERRLEMLAWFEAVMLDTVAAFEAFLARYPESDLAATAKRLKARAALQAASSRGLIGVSHAKLLLPPRQAEPREIVRTEKVPVIRKVVRKVPVIKHREIIRKVPEIRYKTVVKEVVEKVPVVKEVVRKVPVVQIKEVVRRVPEIKYKTIVKEVVKTVPGPTRIVTRIVKVPVPGPPRRVRYPVVTWKTRVVTRTKTVRYPVVKYINCNLR